MAFIRIQHADIEGTGVCSEEAYELVYKAKGWQIAPDDEQPAPAEQGDPVNPADPAAVAVNPTPSTLQES